MADLRIFSYLPNPRIWKSTIAGRLCGVEVELRGAKPGELSGWLWDFDAHPLTDADREAPENAPQQPRTGFNTALYKTPAFLEAHPFGTVPAAFSPDGSVGIFESNSIMRTVARLGADRFPLYGDDAYAAARIDSFLDVSLVFARDSQIYLLSFRGDGITPEIHANAERAFTTYMTGIERALSPDRSFLVGDTVTLADICFAAELTLFSREQSQATALAAIGRCPIMDDQTVAQYPRALAHYEKLCAHEAFAPDIAPYREKLQADIEADRTRMKAAGA
jgi:glutathione S-transferase